MSASSRVMALLAHGVPLSLLLDLAEAGGPDSVAIARHEAARPVVLPVEDPVPVG